MKKNLLFSFLLITSFCWGQKSIVSQYAELISTADLKENLSILASDALEGRNTGSRGQKMAAAYISHYFQELGLTAPIHGSYYMPMDLYSLTPSEIYIKVGSTQFHNFNDIVYYGSINSNKEISTDIVFVGKGRETDYGNVIVKNKAVAILSEQLSLNMAQDDLRSAITLAQKKGAHMVFIIPLVSTASFNDFASQAREYLSQPKIYLHKPDTTTSRGGIFFLTPSMSEKIFRLDIEKIKQVASADPAKKALSKIKPSKVSYQITHLVKTVKSENVLGYLEGNDKKDELIVITAHYDHIGIKSSGVGDLINNGADDDGSGTVSVLQLAKAFAQAKKEGNGPRRSILFMTVTAEEVGLLGSEYYVNHPVFPLRNTVVDLNIDMIGRRDPSHQGKPDYVYVIGSDKISTELHQINERNNHTYTNLEFDYLYNDINHPDNLYKRSDHWNFAKHNIPIIFYFDGIHEDYHKVSDEVSKIDFDLLAKRTKCIFYTAWEIAHKDTRLVLDK